MRTGCWFGPHPIGFAAARQPAYDPAPMPPKPAIPTEFEDLLTPPGKRVLAGSAPGICGALADPRRRFVALGGMIAAAKAERLRRVLEREMAELLSDLNQPIPPETIWDMERNYDDWLPKSV